MKLNRKSMGHQRESGKLNQLTFMVNSGFYIFP